LHDNSGVSGDNECQSAAENAAGGGYYSEFHVLYVGWGRGYSLVVGCWFLVVSGGGRWHAASGFSKFQNRSQGGTGSLGEPFLHSNGSLYNPTHARNTLENDGARLAIGRLGLLKRRTGSANSAT
jgi:hypothetical protein